MWSSSSLLAYIYVHCRTKASPRDLQLPLSSPITPVCGITSHDMTCPVYQR